MLSIVEPKDDEHCAVNSYNILERFSESIKFPFRPDLESVFRLVSGRERYCRFCESESGEVVGGMLCLKLQHPINNSVSISSEIFFYIDSCYRGGSTAIRLIKEYSDWCYEHKINICTIISTPESPEGISRLYRKYGFNPNERTFVRWQA